MKRNQNPSSLEKILEKLEYKSDISSLEIRQAIMEFMETQKPVSAEKLNLR
jgi:hypothetical protein